jgi:hypothetical protein
MVGDSMSEMIEARVVRKTSNALQMTFLNAAAGEPLAVAVQGGADGKGSKFATLLGFKNGGTGTHVVTYGDGSVLHVKSVSMAPTEVTRPDGVSIATIERGGEESVARASGGTPILTFVANPAGAKTVDAFHLVVRGSDGAELGTLDIVRTLAGWNLFDDLYWELLLPQYAAPLKLPFLGSRIAVNRALTELERDVLVVVSVDVAIGLRPYVKEMT